MATLGSRQSFHEGLTTGIICYPRHYHEEGAMHEQYVDCVDQDGQPLRLHVIPPERHIEAARKSTDQTVPSIEKLAETHRRAQNPCFATPDNGPASPTGGVFVAEQVQAMDAEKGVYQANWLSVLRNDESGAVPRVGIGYLESNFILPFTPEVEQMKMRLSDMNMAIAEVKRTKADVESIDGKDVLSFISERNELAMEMYNMTRSKFYVAVETQYRRMLDANMDNEAMIRRQVLELIDSNSTNGMYGGVILRPYHIQNGVKTVITDSVRRVNHQYDYTKKLVPDVSKVWSDFVSHGGSGWLKYMAKEKVQVDIIPIQRVNAGKPTTEKFSKEFGRGMPKYMRAFVDEIFHHAPYCNIARSNGYIARPIAMRMADTRKKEFGDTLLLSNIHSFGKALGHELEIDKDMNRTYSLDTRPEPAPWKRSSFSKKPTSNGNPEP